MLTVTVNGNGAVRSWPEPNISCADGTCTQPYPVGTPVTLTPLADSENVFGGRTNCSAPSCPSCNMTMEEDKSVTANFWDQCQILLRTMGYQPLTNA
jgi:hypothetical protein